MPTPTLVSVPSENTGLEFHVERQLWQSPNDIAIHCVHHQGRGTLGIALPVSFTLQSAAVAPQCPMLQISRGAAQSLMDALWNVGIRPSSGEGSAGQLLATQQHLEDFRKLVFKKDLRPLLK